MQNMTRDKFWDKKMSIELHPCMYVAIHEVICGGEARDSASSRPRHVPAEPTPLLTTLTCAGRSLITCSI